MRPRPTRTIGQLHFEDLDPHRFEDLARQLVYSLRQWSVLEALGRSGADDGVDIRGIELRRRLEADTAVDDTVGALSDEEQRVWFIQCKRERSLGPAKARRVATSALEGGGDPPHGFMLIAPADLSKQARQALAAELHDRGVQEVIALGRGELEDLLFQPENDHLLFAYFGISLQVRKRGITSDLRGRLAKKRAIYGTIGDLDHRGSTPVLVRDPAVAGYPFRERVDPFDEQNPPWLVAAFRDHSNPDTLPLIVQRHHAWLSADHKSYDVIATCSHVLPGRGDRADDPPEKVEACDRLGRFFYNEVPEAERAWLEVVGWIDYDDILMLDDLGDAFYAPPHVLVTRDPVKGFFSHVKSFVSPDRDQRGHLPVEDLRRVRRFPDPIPNVEWGNRW